MEGRSFVVVNRFWRGMYNHHDHVLPRQSIQSRLASIIRETEVWRKERVIVEEVWRCG